MHVLVQWIAVGDLLASSCHLELCLHAILGDLQGFRSHDSCISRVLTSTSS